MFTLGLLFIWAGIPKEFMASLHPADVAHMVCSTIYDIHRSLILSMWSCEVLRIEEAHWQLIYLCIETIRYTKHACRASNWSSEYLEALHSVYIPLPTPSLTALIRSHVVGLLFATYDVHDSADIPNHTRAHTSHWPGADVCVQYLKSPKYHGFII